jgi:hypothetical protein
MLCYALQRSSRANVACTGSADAERERREELLARLGALSSEMQATSFRLLASCSLPLSQLPAQAEGKPWQLAERGAQLRRAADAALAAAAAAREVEAATVEAVRMRLDAAAARQAAETAEARSAAAREETARLKEVIKVTSASCITIGNR